MKKKLLGLSMLALAAACSENGAPDTYNDWAIKPKAEVETAVVRSTTASGPISSTFDTDFPISMYAKGSTWLAGSSANWINNDAATVAGAAGHAVSFASGPYYYPSDGTVLTFYACAPRATESTAATAGVGPSVTHSITGHEDVMWASATGAKVASAPAVNPSLSFTHKLTQLRFTFKSGATYPASGNKVVSLLVKAQPSTVTMAMETGACTFSGLADMQALSSAKQTSGIEIASAGTDADSPIMTKDATGATAYTLDIVVKPAGGASNLTYLNVPVNVTSLIGSAHMITLTFNGTAVSATATVADWTNGSGGSATVQ